MCLSQTQHPKEKIVLITELLTYQGNSEVSDYVTTVSWEHLESVPVSDWWTCSRISGGHRDPESGQRGRMMLIFKNREQKPAIFTQIPRKNEAVNNQTIYKHLEDNNQITLQSTYICPEQIMSN